MRTKRLLRGHLPYRTQLHTLKGTIPYKNPRLYYTRQAPCVNISHIPIVNEAAASFDSESKNGY